MKKLPEIYKEIVNVSNNKNTFYSKNETITNLENIQEKKEITNSNSQRDILKNVFSLGKYSYIKKVRIETKDKVYETRLIRRNSGRILTIDNDIIDENSIISLEIL